MTKKKLYILIVLPLVAILAACASLQIPGVNAAAQPSQSARQGGFNADPAKMPVEQKLGIGILKLEGTPQAVTPQEAKNLLPLWKALKTLSTSNNTSPDEVNALYKQIEETLTPDQVKAIQNLTWTQADLRATMQKYGIQFANGNGFGGGATLDPSARATRVAQFQQRNGNAGGGGAGFGGGGGGFGGAGGGGGFGGNGGFGGGNGQNGATAQRTPQPGQGRRAFGGLNIIFINPVITLLQQKAGA